MRSVLIFVLILLLTVSIAGFHSSDHEELKLEGEISNEDKNFYPEQKIVGFPAVKSGDETVRYSNASYSEYVRWQIKDEGIQKIRSEIKSNLHLKDIRTGSTSEGIEIIYIKNESIERNYTYEEFRELVPSQVKGSYEVNGETVNATVPVKISKREDSATKDQLDYSVAKSSESFGSSSTGENYNTNFTILNVSQGELMGEQVRNVSIGENSIRFTGYIELPQPCNKINRTHEQKDSELVLQIDTYSTEEPCVDVIAFKKYSFNIESEEPVRLEVRHNGREVRTMETPEHHDDDPGIVAKIINFFQKLV